ncbi:MAG: hypothetical protein M5U22_22475 [Thermoleophilia bacterium]|nr:hypothetical protein [Thermoleophilia bacterium]
MISASLGMMLSLFLVVLSFFGTLSDLLPPWVAWLWIPVWFVIVTTAALLLPGGGRRLTFVPRFAVPLAGVLCLAHGQVGLTLPLLVLTPVMWWGSWVAGLRAGGRSIGGVARDLRFFLRDDGGRLRRR